MVIYFFNKKLQIRTGVLFRKTRFFKGEKKTIKLNKSIRYCKMYESIFGLTRPNRAELSPVERDPAEATITKLPL